jgi:uncharacterized membrane protein
VSSTQWRDSCSYPSESNERRGPRIRRQVEDHQLPPALAAVRRGFQEFLRLPVAIIAGFLALSAAMYLLDNAAVAWLQPARAFLSNHIFGDTESTGQLLGALAGSLITVASITFSLLLLAVGQSSASLTHAVIDQFLRRSINQIFFGYFVGLAIFALITLSTVDPPFNPVFGATVVLLLAIIAIIMLLFLIYVTIYQMRPAVIVQRIHDLTFDARRKQLALIAGTRPTPSGTFAVSLPVICSQSGYVTVIDHERIINATVDAGGEAQVELCCSIGDYVAFSDVMAIVRAGNDECAEQTGTAVSAAIRLEHDRSIGMDPSYGIEQLVTVAWTTISTSKQNPAPGLNVNYALRDILARLTGEDFTVQRDPTSPVTYQDTLIEDLFGAFELLAIVSTESMQPQQFAVVAETFARMYGRIPAAWQSRMETAIMHILPGLGDHVLTARLDRALGELIETLQAHARHEVAAAVDEAQRRLRATVGVLNSRATRVTPD